MTTEQVWLGIGLLGQAFFSTRFLVQWIASERAKKSVVPRHFWYFSVGGGMTLLAYAIHRRDPVFLVRPAGGLPLCGRDLFFLFRHPQRVGPRGGGYDGAPRRRPAGRVRKGRAGRRRGVRGRG